MSVRWVWPVAIVAALFLIPWGCYVVRPERRLDIVVVDKTVPFENRLEHRSLFWLLNHLKIVRPDGEPYDRDVDYVGAFPGPEPGDPPERTTGLTFEDALRADLIYFADTYGVYRDDLESGPAMRAALERSPKIYGGLEPLEARAAARALESGKTVVAEFNTMASPTGREARETMEAVLGVRWTRWAGRFFSRLENEEEVPGWMRRNYERIREERWEFRGPGYVLVRDDDWIEVLRVGEEAERIPLTIERELPVDPLLVAAKDRIPYPYWTAIVRTDPGVKVLASYVSHLTPAGRERLRDLGIPMRFPAVCRRVAPGGGVAYYFAGDFADNPMHGSRVPFAGYVAYKRWSEGVKLAPSETAFYWRFYVPMMQRLLLGSGLAPQHSYNKPQSFCRYAALQDLTPKEQQLLKE